MQATLVGVARRRVATGLLFRSHQLSTSACRRAPDSGDSAPKPPPPIDDSTSALDYKRRTTLQHRPPPLPVIDVRSRSAEEAVTNILYNTPQPSLAPFKKCEPHVIAVPLCPHICFSLRHVLNCLVQNEPGVLSRVSGILAGRGFNIDSLVVCRTEIRDLSRMCIVLRGQDAVIEQARRQLEDLVSAHHPLPLGKHHGQTQFSRFRCAVAYALTFSFISLTCILGVNQRLRLCFLITDLPTCVHPTQRPAHLHPIDVMPHRRRSDMLHRNPVNPFDLFVVTL